MEEDRIHFEKFLPTLKARIAMLVNRSGKNVQLINFVSDKHDILISGEEASTNNTFYKKENIFVIQEFLETVLLDAAKKEMNNDSPDYSALFLIFRDSIIDQLKIIESYFDELAILSRPIALQFLKDFSAGQLSDPLKFVNELEGVVSHLATKNSLNLDHSVFNKVKSLLANSKTKISERLDTVINSLGDIIQPSLHQAKPLSPLSPRTSGMILTKHIQFVDQAILNLGKRIPETNGFDIHPLKHIYAGMGYNGGDLVIRNIETNKELVRAKIENTGGRWALQNCLFSPNGSYILVSTYSPACIYVYDNNGARIQSIENIHTSPGYGSVWLNNSEVAVGFEDGLLKMFNIQDKKEIGEMKIAGLPVWGMDALSDTNILIGDYSGTLYNIIWKKKKN